MDLRSLIRVAAAILLSAAPAAAHAGFLVPVLDASDTSGEVILNASFSDDFPDPDIALHAQDWTIVGPSGERFAFDDIGANGTLTALRANLESEGTYRLSSGERLGRKGKVARIDGELTRLGGDGMARADLPDGTEVLTSQTATVSDIYMTPPLLPLAARSDLPSASMARPWQDSRYRPSCPAARVRRVCLPQHS